MQIDRQMQIDIVPGGEGVDDVKDHVDDRQIEIDKDRQIWIDRLIDIDRQIKIDIVPGGEGVDDVRDHVDDIKIDIDRQIDVDKYSTWWGEGR